MAEKGGGLPAKLYYRIGEVAGIVGVEPHVLRYWETEFRSIRPQKSAKGQRVYSLVRSHPIWRTTGASKTSRCSRTRPAITAARSQRPSWCHQIARSCVNGEASRHPAIWA